MSISKVCGEFTTLWKFFPDELNESKEYNFNSRSFNNYCPKPGNCNNDIDKINAGCLWLFNAFFNKYGTSAINNTYKDDTVCIMIWLGYILNLKSHDGINTLNNFYSQHIQNNTKYTEDIFIGQAHKNYKGIIDAIKEYMDINISHMSRFYNLLKVLCNMNSAYTSSNSNDFSEYVKKFAEEYENLLNDNDNIDGSPYSKVLLVLSRYYNNLVNGRPFNDKISLPSLPTEKKKIEVIVEKSKETKAHDLSDGTDQSDIETRIQSDDTTLSESSLVNKLVIVLSILAVIPIFLGISYKVNNKELTNIIFKNYFH
ncbi:putative bir1 protein [Plasmodium yoelii yoelii]|uniref:Bir1 protein n=1 Tax=Plasmodium yoelii yoelii TaxID=73239 RepID=Q7RJ63_PLAYO|nr:putative bir1 protein [Plasmodium yoelii yoelii]